MESSQRAPSQYQHFVPQFLLRNFAHPPRNGGSSTSAALPNGRPGKKTSRRDVVVNCLDMTSETPRIVQKPVKRTLGQVDMYLGTAKRYQDVEKMLSQLESKASEVFRNIAKSFEERHRGIWLTRDERNLVRKFLFLMKYRFTYATPRSASTSHFPVCCTFTL